MVLSPKQTPWSLFFKEKAYHLVEESSHTLLTSNETVINFELRFELTTTEYTPKIFAIPQMIKFEDVFWNL